MQRLLEHCRAVWEIGVLDFPVPLHNGMLAICILTGLCSLATECGGCPGVWHASSCCGGTQAAV